MFRRSGSVACFFVSGSTPDPQNPGFLEALAEHRFRTIEDAADEQTSIGWVTSGDPTGGSFEMEDMDCDGTTWLRMRIDKKSAPTKWLQIHREAAEKSAGRKLSAKERKELREDLLSKLMPRVLPTIRMIDALYLPHRSMLLLFGTSQSVREAFLSLFYRSFSASLTPADPGRLAVSLDLDKQHTARLSEVAPVSWPSEGGPRVSAPTVMDSHSDADADSHSDADSAPHSDADSAPDESHDIMDNEDIHETQDFEEVGT